MLSICPVEADIAIVHGPYCSCLLLAAPAASQSDYNALDCAAYCLGSPV